MANELSEDQKYLKKKSRKRLISLIMVISGIIVLIVGINMVRTGFAGLDDGDPTVGLYVGGIFTIIGGVILAVGGIIYTNFDVLKKKYIRMIRKIADAVEEDRKEEKM